MSDSEADGGSTRGEEQKLAAGESCTVETCDSAGVLPDGSVTIEDGGSYRGYERQADGTCVAKSYRCDDGTLVPD